MDTYPIRTAPIGQRPNPIAPQTEPQAPTVRIRDRIWGILASAIATQPEDISRHGALAAMIFLCYTKYTDASVPHLVVRNYLGVCVAIAATHELEFFYKWFMAYRLNASRNRASQGNEGVDSGPYADSVSNADSNSNPSSQAEVAARNLSEAPCTTTRSDPTADPPLGDFPGRTVGHMHPVVSFPGPGPRTNDPALKAWMEKTGSLYWNNRDGSTTLWISTPRLHLVEPSAAPLSPLESVRVETYGRTMMIPKLAMGPN